LIWLAPILFALGPPASAVQVVNQTAKTSPPSVTLTVQMAGGRHQFRPGEIIPIELEFDSRVPKRFAVDGATYDRSGRLTIDEFLIEPNDAVTDPLLDYFASSGGFIGGGLRTIGVLGEKPFTVQLYLNAWFRFEKPGTYTLSVRSRRVSDDTKAITPEQSVVPVESNIVSFEILPRDLSWEASELTGALQSLNSKGSDPDRRTACRTLRFLGTDVAVDEMIKRYDEERGDGCGFEYIAGLFSAPDRDRVVRRMEAGLRANDQPVSEGYLRTLATLSVYLQHPELRSPQTRATKGKMIPSSELAGIQDLVQAAKATYTEVLDAALPDKSPRARAMILSWRVESGRRADSTSTTAPAASRDRLREQLAATFLALPADRQASLLEYQWRSLGGPAMVPVFRALVEARSPASSPLHDLALRRLYDVAPGEGRTRILREIANPAPTASLKTLGMLPDRELPELDAVLAANVEANDGSDGSIHEELLHRYASAAVSARVLSHVDGRLTRMACRPQTALLAYFVRVNPELGNTLLDRAMASRGTTGCYTTALRDVARLRMTPAMEAAAVAHLDDPDPQVAIGAADTLGRYGSGASVQPLRARFERWHRAWEGRQEEFRYSHVADRPNAVQGMVEVTLLQALGQGQGWLTDEPGLRELRTLCVTDNCRAHADSMIGSAAGETRITIARVSDPDDSTIMLAQYHLASIAALERKLAQYPKGTIFTIDVSALDPQMARVVVSEVKKFAETHGITIRP
jgi:hypothetical protein